MACKNRQTPDLRVVRSIINSLTHSIADEDRVGIPVGIVSIDVGLSVGS